MPNHTEETIRWYQSEGYVYFIGAGSPTKAIKIGVTVRGKIRQRLRTHQSSNHDPLRILGVIPTSTMVEAEEMEKALHAQFSDLQRFKQGTAGHEWFTASTQLLEELDRVTTKPEELAIESSVAVVGPGIEDNASN